MADQKPTNGQIVELLQRILDEMAELRHELARLAESR